MDIRGFEVLRDNLKANLKPQEHLWISVLFVDIRGFEVLRDNLKTHLNSHENRYISVLFVDIRGFEVLWDNLKTRSACRMVPERRVSAVGEALGPSVKPPRIHSARAASIDHLLGSTFLSILGLHVFVHNCFSTSVLLTQRKTVYKNINAV